MREKGDSDLLEPTKLPPDPLQGRPEQLSMIHPPSSRGRGLKFLVVLLLISDQVALVDLVRAGVDLVLVGVSVVLVLVAAHCGTSVRVSCSVVAVSTVWAVVSFAAMTAAAIAVASPSLGPRLTVGRANDDALWAACEVPCLLAMDTLLVLRRTELILLMRLASPRLTDYVEAPWTL